MAYIVNIGHNSYITLLLPPPARHVGSVPRDYCQVKATEDSRECQLFSIRSNEKETELPFNNNVHYYNSGFCTLLGIVYSYELNFFVLTCNNRLVHF